MHGCQTIADSGHREFCGTLDKKGSGLYEAQYLNAGKLETIIISGIRGYILTGENLIELVRMVNKRISLLVTGVKALVRRIGASPQPFKEVACIDT